MNITCKEDKSMNRATPGNKLKQGKGRIIEAL